MLLSIITINYNNLPGLKKTVESVIRQTFSDFEWIVIDGGSTDGSKEYILENQDRFSYWCSEPDHGIYNAFNKGLRHAAGDYVQFLNSGDWLYETSTLEQVFTLIGNQDHTADIHYGNIVKANDNGVLNPVTYPNELGVFFFSCDNICHQAIIYKRKLFNNNPFDESFSIVSDWAMNMKLLFEGNTFSHLNLFVVYFDTTGISSVGGLKHYEERDLAFAKYIPKQIQVDIALYEKNYNFSRHRKSTRWVMDHAIRFCQWLDRQLSKIEHRRHK